MAGFDTTRWSLVLAAREPGPGARDALEALCRAYRPAVLAYVRGWGYARSDAEDLTQSFFARLVEKRVHAAADPARGRFRVFLRTALHNFILSARAAAGTARRGSNRASAGFDPDELATESDADLPDRAFERAWALLVVNRALQALRREARAAGKLELFDRLKPFLLESPDRDDYERIAAETATRPNTIAVATHRLRARLRELVLAELAETVADPAEVDAEYGALLEAMRPARDRQRAP
jgi:RNA polymerase sigma-70 factor (ECF subfamily)